MAPVYEASSSLLASRAPSSFGNLALISPPPVDARVYQRAVLDGSVVPTALNTLNGSEPDAATLEAFMRNVSVTIENQDISSIIRIDVKNSDPIVAAAYANAISESLVTWDRGRAQAFVDSSIKALEDSIAEIDGQLLSATKSGDQASSQSLQALAATMRAQRVRELESAQTRSASAVVVGLLTPLVVAVPPNRAVGPKLVFNAFVALLLGLTLGYGLQLLFWALNPSVRDRQGLAMLIGEPVLADFSRGLQTKRRFKTTVNFLRAAVMNSVAGDSAAVVGIASVEDNGSSQFTANNLAASLRIGGYRTLLVRLTANGGMFARDSSPSSEPALHLDAFLRNPDLPFPIPTEPNEQLRGLVTVIDTQSPDSLGAATLASRFPPFLQRAQEAYDCVLVELPPLLRNADFLTVHPMLDGLILCVATTTPRKEVASINALMKTNRINLLGTILIGSNQPRGA